MPAARIFLRLIADLVVYLGLVIRPRKAVAAENLFLRRQLALYQERKVDPRRIAQALDTSIANLRLRVLKTPYRSPKANSLCERLIGSLRRECLDWAIPLK